ncbi:MAG: RHS repeat-associated core domain-containing protein, partial [Bacteroidaceae bacterium]|nr:RHS repeat-associated core domain-containing protein [Bacteroidaceae bacterium]
MNAIVSPYHGEYNDDYVDGQFCPKDIVGCTREFANEFAFLSLARQFCCNDGSMEAAMAQAQKTKARAVAKSFKDPDNYENLQFFYHPDHLGSSSFITNLEGEVVQHIEYVPFGEVFIEERNSVWNTPYLFNAKEFDEETGMYYYGARYYEPRLSLWMSVDKLADYAPSWTPYRAFFNNPIRFFDPT